MLKVLMAEFNPWDYRLQLGGHKYASGFLAADWQVFWLTTFLNINRLIRRREDDHVFIRGWRRGVVELEKNLLVYTPFSFLPYLNAPLLRSRLIADNTLYFTYPKLASILKNSHFEQPDVLWITNPRCYALLEMIKPKLVVYRMADDVGAFPAEPKLSIQLEEAICRRADLIFATAHNLVEKASQWSDKVYHLPNGVDFDLFVEPELGIPRDIAEISQPRVLYVGAIDTWFDFVTLTTVAQHLPDYSFIIIGPVSGGEQVNNNLNALKLLPNVHVLGSRPFTQVRNYMRHTDIGMIPFIPNQLTHSISPIKLFEYLASGLSVVASRLHEIEQIASPAMLYNDPQEFIHKLRIAGHRNEYSSKKSIEFASKNSWQKRFQYAHEQIQKKLQTPLSQTAR